MQSMYRYNQTCSKSQYSSSMRSTADDSFKYLGSLYSMLCPFVGFSDEPEMILQTKLQLLRLLKIFNPLQDTPANIPKFSKCNTCKPYLMRSPFWQVNRSSNSQESVTVCWGSHLFKTHHNGTYTGFPFLPLWIDWENQKHGLALWEHKRLLRCFIIFFIYRCHFFF
jgi:hypothetical protein